MEQQLNHLVNIALSAPHAYQIHQASIKAAEEIQAHIKKLNEKIADLEDEVKELK